MASCGVGVARIFDRVLTQYPDDLYIPTRALLLVLESFEGPLDLLLYLVRKKSIDASTFSVAAVACQYMQYVDASLGSDPSMDYMARYLVMASVLIDIKSRLLLPAWLQEAEDADQEDELRIGLVRRCVEYGKIKYVAAMLAACAVEGRDFEHVVVWRDSELPHEPACDVGLLARAWCSVVERQALVEPHAVEREVVCVRKYMKHILSQLESCDIVDFCDLLIMNGVVSKLLMVVYFLAILELVRQKRVGVHVNETNGFFCLYKDNANGIVGH